MGFCCACKSKLGMNQSRASRFEVVATRILGSLITGTTGALAGRTSG